MTTTGKSATTEPSFMNFQTGRIAEKTKASHSRPWEAFSSREARRRGGLRAVSALRLDGLAAKAVAIAPFGHEHVELGLVLGLAQALEEFLELALLLFEPA